MVFAAGLWLTAAGLAGGLLLSPIAGRALRGLLFGVSSTDSTAMLFAPIIILVIAVIACAAPAYVAVRTEPASALREQ
jgi:ABC-type lipoprotein release transport system permease subunit